MEFLSQQNKRVAGINPRLITAAQFIPMDEILAKDKHVVVIGGGDTGSDCVGTSGRHGAKSVSRRSS
jgi:glutamate synthase (NADPH/NADH) small chain